MRQAERLIFDLRRSLPVVLRGERGGALVVAVEGLDDAALNDAARLSGVGPTQVLSFHRLASLGIAVDGMGASLPFAELPPAAEVLRRAIARDARLPDGLRASTEEERAALLLMRRAQLIPSALVFPVAEAQWAEVSRRCAEGAWLSAPTAAVIALCESGPGKVAAVSEARVPLAGLGDSRFVVFREEDGVREHVAVLLGERGQWPTTVPVRVHSTCLTGDLFGSQRCDCGAQLRNSLATIHELGGGVVLYLAQEGRGIGLANKLRAYCLQDEGLDTIDADQVIGFGKDERDYRAAHEMLTALDIPRIELLTNNPDKVRSLRAAGIDVASRRALFGQLTDHNSNYLRTKADRHGHLLDELLAKVVHR
ncbi:GTP cyclohydrolase-2 [Betaproteobacteria bacterium]|nr:GTP cyclohydrolase-2 [Betaproteobacteria bacterium]GHT98096.1 GTP cyclohydrolase-2 [Betaproteobacteria bacterium]GHU18825.1 GTP cyclohydrolase-2 [Betaproteobacteria bacterium]